MDSSSLYCIKLFTLSLLLSWSCASSSSPAAPILPQPSSAFLAADTLRLRGYSIFASLLVSISSTANFSGTLLAPPDFAFSFASTKILNNHRPPPRPSIPVLLYHTLSPPLILTWPTLSSRHDGDELRTFYNNNCLYLFRTSRTDEVSVSSSPFTNPIATVKIRQPDLYADENLIVHGIDGVLNPSFATRCSGTYSDPTVTHQLNRIFLDRAMRALRRKGFNVVASAMSVRRSDLLPLTSVTVFAVSDEHLFLTPGAFRYNFRHHVIPMRQRFADLARMAVGGVEFFTLAPNKTVAIVSKGGAVTVDGVSVGMKEVYHNRWIAVVSLLSSLDDVAESKLSPPASPTESVRSPPPAATGNGNFAGVPSPAPIPRVSPKSPRVPPPPPIPRVSVKGKSPVPSPAPTTGGSVKGKPHRAPSLAPAHWKDSNDGSPILAPVATGNDDSSDSIDAPSPAVEVDEDDNSPSKGGPSRSPSPAPSPEIKALNKSPPPYPAKDDGNNVNCELNVISNGVEGGDLLCPDRIDRAVRQLRETGRDDVELFLPLDAEHLTHSGEFKHLNIADDVFYYT